MEVTLRTGKATTPHANRPDDAVRNFDCMRGMVAPKLSVTPLGYIRIAPDYGDAAGGRSQGNPVGVLHGS
eukprot:15454230-Alexandrium_andersonii.AAC.1